MYRPLFYLFILISVEIFSTIVQSFIRLQEQNSYYKRIPVLCVGHTFAYFIFRTIA